MHFFFKSTRHLLSIYTYLLRLPRWFSGKESARFDPWVEKIPWNRKWQPTPVLLPGEFHGQRSLEDYSPQGHKELDTTERTAHTHTHTHKTSPNNCKSQFLVLDSWIPLSVCLSIHLSDQHLSPIYLSYSFCLWFNPGWCSYKILKVKNYA